MKMDIEIQRPPEPLHDGHRATAPVHHPGRPRLTPQEAEDRSHERPRHPTAQVVIPGESVAQTMREAQNPLAHGHRREHPVDEVRGSLSHAPPATARTKTATTTREGHEPVQTTRGTTKSRETAAEPAATEKVAELLLDEPGQPFAIAQIGGLRAERLEVIAHDLIQHTLGGLPRLIARRRRGHAVLSAGSMPRGTTPKQGRFGSSAAQPRSFCPCHRG